MVASLVCLLWIGGALVWLARSLLRRARAKGRFRALAADRGFDPEETEDLWRLSRYADSGDRAAVLTAPEVFDACVAEARKAAGDNLVAWPKHLAASRVRSLRRNFGKARKPRHNITHTREIEPNQPVKVRLAETEAFDSFILRAAENELHLALPHRAETRRHIIAEQPFLVSFTRPNDARYEFSSTVMRRGSDRLTEFIGVHADLKRVQQRADVRVRCRNDVCYAVVNKPTAEMHADAEEPPELAHSATLYDLSASGASFISSARRTAGAWILLRLELDGEPDSLILPAQVVRQTTLNGTSSPHRRTCVRFGPLLPHQQHRLDRIMADLQQQVIRRMLSRAGAAEEQEPALVLPRETRGEAKAGMEHRSNRGSRMPNVLRAAAEASEEVARTRAPSRQPAAMPNG